MYDAVSGTFFRDIVFKVLNLTFLILYSVKVIDFSQFILLYVLAYCSPTVFLFVLLWVRGQISFASNLKFVTPELRKSMTSVSLFGVLNGLSDKLANQIDRIMIVSYIGLGPTGIFGTMTNFGSLVSMPSRSLKKIASTVIAESWKNKDLKTINQIYSQSGLHQFMLGCLLFIGIWINIDNIFEIVPDQFTDGKYVVFFIGLGHVVQMLSGVSGVVIQSSPYYRMQTVFMVMYGLLVIITNAIMIPIWGITGAAVASLSATFVFNLSKYLFLLKKYQFQPFNYRYLLVVLISVLAYYLGTLLPKLDWFVFDIAIRSALVGGVYVLLMFVCKISTEFNQFVKKKLGMS
jgi:O-antigen/teichoic acid export membrane protein